MATVSKRRKKPAGSSPGSVVYVGVEKTTPVKVARIRYSGDGYEAPRIVAPSECRPESSWPGTQGYRFMPRTLRCPAAVCRSV